jgi:hypothetical protein
MPTEILRPNGDSSQVGAPGHNAGTSAPFYDKIDESGTANDADYVRTNDGSVIYRFDLTNTALTTETISGLDVFHRANPQTDVADGMSQAGVRIGTTNSWGTQHIGGSGALTDFTDTSIARPGGGSWAVSDLNTLLAILSLDPRDDGEGPLQTWCTQQYITVNYTSGGGGDAVPQVWSQYRSRHN